jgi:tetratricopeptide (TPR) repeat protein
MLRYFTLLACILFVSVDAAHAQDTNPYTDSIKVNLQKATSAHDKVVWLGELARFYLAANRSLSDKYANEMLQVAEESRDRQVIILSLLNNARRFSNYSVQVENINAAMKFSQKALDMAKANNLTEYEAWAYIYLASCERANSDYDKALSYDNLALALAANSDNDSLRVNTYISTGDTYLARNDKMLAFRNYLQALDIAETKTKDNYYLQRDVYHTLSNFYSSLDEWEKAKDYIYKANALTYKYKQRYDRLNNYNTLGRIYSKSKQYDLAQTFYDKSLALADTLKFGLVKLNTYGGMLSMYIAEKQAAKTLTFIRERPELQQFLETAGFDYVLDQIRGMAYIDFGKLDSAEYYLAKAAPYFENKANRMNKYWFYDNMGTLFEKKKDYSKSLFYWKKAEAMSNEIGDLELKMEVSQRLDSLYQKSQDFRNAYIYNNRYRVYSDSLRTLATEKDLMVLEVENENKRKEREALQAEEATRTRHNIQYMGITVAIACVFILLTMFGIFRVSSTTIRILGFFAFIFLFEFIILLADHQIHHLTHGEPWMIMAIKIVLISILLPLHHFLEEKVIHYLTSRKMLELNKAALFSKLMPKREPVEE